ncbi:hypothetical protein OB13_14995, partial [Pontibacter sp. HJ8]
EGCFFFFRYANFLYYNYTKLAYGQLKQALLLKNLIFCCIKYFQLVSLEAPALINHKILGNWLLALAIGTFILTRLRSYHTTQYNNAYHD